MFSHFLFSGSFLFWWEGSEPKKLLLLLLNKWSYSFCAGDPLTWILRVVDSTSYWLKFNQPEVCTLIAKAHPFWKIRKIILDKSKLALSITLRSLLYLYVLTKWDHIFHGDKEKRLYIWPSLLWHRYARVNRFACLGGLEVGRSSWLQFIGRISPIPAEL